jgi:hypothetical protein
MKQENDFVLGNVMEQYPQLPHEHHEGPPMTIMMMVRGQVLNMVVLSHN